MEIDPSDRLSTANVGKGRMFPAEEFFLENVGNPSQDFPPTHLEVTSLDLYQERPKLNTTCPNHLVCPIPKPSHPCVALTHLQPTCLLTAYTCAGDLNPVFRGHRATWWLPRGLHSTPQGKGETGLDSCHRGITLLEYGENQEEYKIRQQT